MWLAFALGDVARAGTVSWDGCTILESPNPGDRAIRCPDFEATATSEKPASAEAPMLDLIARNLLVTRLGGASLAAEPGGKIERATVTIAGAARAGIRWTEPDGTVGTFAAVPTAADRIRFIGCQAAPDHASACADALESLAASVPAPTRATPVDTTFVGRTLAAGPDCSRTQGQLTCPRAGDLTWRAVPSDIPVSAADLAGAMAATMAKTMTVARSPRPCTIDGFAASCEIVSGGTVHALVGFAVVRGERTVAQCNWAGERGAPPAPCDQVFQLQ